MAYIKKSEREKENATNLKYSEPKINYSKNNDKHDIVEFLKEQQKYDRAEKLNLQKKIDLQEIEILHYKEELKKTEINPHQIWVDLINKATPMIMPILKARFAPIGAVESNSIDDQQRNIIVLACNKWQDHDENFLRNIQNIAIFAQLQPDLFKETAEQLNNQINGN
jgi:hypothetical protein